MSDSATWPERYAATSLGWETAPDELVVATSGRLSRWTPPRSAWAASSATQH